MVALINAEAGSRMAISEALTNVVGARWREDSEEYPSLPTGCGPAGTKERMPVSTKR